MDTVSLDFLNHIEEPKDQKFTLRIKPLCDLSISNRTGDAFLFDPTELEFKILGMIQNSCGLHIAPSKTFESYLTKLFDWKKVRVNRNNFIPLFYKSIDLNILNVEDLYSSKRYLDVERRLSRRDDSTPEKISTYVMSKNLLSMMGNYQKETIKSIRSKNPTSISTFYTVVKKREYIIMEKDIIVECSTNDATLSLLKSLEKNNLCFLGNSGSLVDVKFEF